MHDPMTLDARLAEACGRYAAEPTRMSPRPTWAAVIATGSRPPQCHFPCLQWLPEVSQ